jgi:hypothetical protein
MRISSLALAAALFLASQTSVQAQATYHEQATGSNLTVLAATNGDGGYITHNPYYTTGPNQYTPIAPFIGPLPSPNNISTLWNSTYPIHSAVAHGDYVTLYYAEACTIYFWNVTTNTNFAYASYAAGTYASYEWNDAGLPEDTDTLGFVVYGASGSVAYIYLQYY